MLFTSNTHASKVEDAKAVAVALKKIHTGRHEFLRTTAKELGIGIVHIYDTENPKGGLTVAYKRCSPYRSGKMVTVAVHTCSEHDNFDRKIGTSGALGRFIEGNTIDLPILKTWSTTNISWAVKSAFTALYERI